MNHRCPAPVVERAVRLIGHNRERFHKVIRSRAGAPGGLILAPDPADEPERTARLLASWPDDHGSRVVLARTNRELRPAVVAAIALGEPFRAPSVDLLVDDPALDGVLTGRTRRRHPSFRCWCGSGASAHRSRPSRGATASSPRHSWPGRHRSPTSTPSGPLSPRPVPDSLTCGATTRAFAGDRAFHQGRRVRPRRGRGFEEGRFPSARAVADAEDPTRALEEERRLGYVAWTRAAARSR